jgi:hypothetical protein
MWPFLAVVGRYANILLPESLRQTKLHDLDS